MQNAVVHLSPILRLLPMLLKDTIHWPNRIMMQMIEGPAIFHADMSHNEVDVDINLSMIVKVVLICI